MKRQQNTVVRPVGWAYLILIGFTFAAAMLRDINLLMIVCCFMAGPFLLNWQTVLLTLRGIEVRRLVPHTVCAGDPLVVELTVSNTRRRGTSWCFTVHDMIARLGDDGRVEEAQTASVLIPRLAAGDTTTVHYQGRLARRGRYRLGSLRLAAAFPLGLVQRNRLITQHDTLIVYPQLGHLTRRWDTLFREADQGAQHVHRRHGWQQGDFHSLRDWRHGDSTRWIHWRTSARKQQLMVRQFEQQANQDFVVLVSLLRPQRASRVDLERVETAVSLAATIAADVCQRGGCRCKLGIGARRPSWLDGPASTGLYDEAMRRLAMAESTVDDVLDELIAQAAAASTPGAHVILVTPQPVDADDFHRRAAAAGVAPPVGWANRLLILDTSSDGLDEFFSAPDLPSEVPSP
ncbi:MAG: DUF58 domain-containing protein [Pirellulales bacterium]